MMYEFKNEYKTGIEAVDDNQSQFLKELMDFLTEWLIGHILNMDKKIPVQK